MSRRERAALEQRLSVTEATALILGGAVPLEAESLRLTDARGRVLATDVVAHRDLPPWRNASMDGYAVRAADIRGATSTAPVRLSVIDTIPAGTIPRRTVGHGEAMRIMTGAPLPEGADSVVRFEDTDRGDETVAIRDARDAAMNVRPRGEDVAAGATALSAGRTIDAASTGLLAAVGAARVDVHRRPRVVILSTGDELVPLEEHERAMREQRIVDVNSHTLAAMAAECGADVLETVAVADEPAALRRTIEQAPDFDVLLTSGGVSAGDHDHVRQVLRQLGAELLVHRLRIRPGAPLAFGMVGGRRWIGLPGNPVSAMVTFELFARPLLRRLGGHARVFRGTVPARSADEIRTAAPLTHFLRVILTPADCGVYEARLTGPQGSGLITSMARADALLIVPEKARVVPPGTVLRAIPLHDRFLASEVQVA